MLPADQQDESSCVSITDDDGNVSSWVRLPEFATHCLRDPYVVLIRKYRSQMEKKMETTITGYIGTTFRSILSFLAHQR